MRSALMLCCVCLLTLPALPAAEGVSAVMAKRGRVRFGPSTEAPTVCTLPPGTMVQVLRQVAGQDGWYEIQFPRQGHAWMHDVVLTPTEDPRILRVTVDKARVRADSRPQGELVAQLDLGETVEWVGSEIDGKWVGRQIGQWYAVYPPSAVAYSHGSVLDLTPQILAKLDASAVVGSQSEIDWQQAQQTYRSFRQTLADDREAGLAQDWQSLHGQLQSIIDEHPRPRTRLLAAKLQGGIKRVLVASERLRDRADASLLPELAVAPRPSAPPAASQPPTSRPVSPPTATEPPAEAATALVAQTPRATAPADPADLTPAAEQPEVISVDSAAETVGWLFQRDVEGSEANHVLVDANSQVAALVQVADASSIILSEFFWRRVAVVGPQVQQTVAIDGIELSLPLITVTDMYLYR